MDQELLFQTHLLCLDLDKIEYEIIHIVNIFCISILVIWTR